MTPIADSSLDPTSARLSKDRLFASLKPLCIQCMDPILCWKWNPSSTRPTSSHPVAMLLAELDSQISGLSVTDAADLVAPLLAYISFPLVEAIKSRMATSTTTECVCRCLAFLLQTSAPSVKYFQPPPALVSQLLMELPLIIFSPSLINNKQTLPQNPRQSLALTAVRPSEDLKLCVVKALSALFAGQQAMQSRPECTTSIDFTSAQLQPILAHNMILLLDLLATEKSIELCGHALNALADLVRLISVSPDALAQFLPGIVSGIVKYILIGDEKRHHSLFVGCFVVLELSIQGTLSDTMSTSFMVKQDTAKEILEQIASKVDLNQLKSLTLQDDSASSKEDKSKSQLKHIAPRTANWYKVNSNNISAILPKLAKLRLHQNPIVQTALLDFSTQLFISCTQSLSGTVSFFVDNIIILCSLLQSETLNNKSKSGNDSLHLAQHQLNTLQTTLQSSMATTRVLTDRLSQLLDHLPTQLTSTSETIQLETLLLINGYIRLLEIKAAPIIQGSINQVVKALLSVLVFETNGVRMVESRHRTLGAALTLMESVSASNAFDQDMSIPAPQRHFQTFYDDRILTQICRLCRLLAYYGDAEMLVDVFSTKLNVERTQTSETIDPLHQQVSQQHFSAALFVLGQIALGTLGGGLKDDGIDVAESNSTTRLSAVRLARSVIAEFLDLSILHMPTNISEKRLFLEPEAPTHLIKSNPTYNRNLQLQPTVRDFNHVIICTSLVLEGLGRLADVLTPDEATLILIDGLYPILEKLGDRSHAVSNAAGWALQQFAQTCSRSPLAFPSVVLPSIDFEKKDNETLPAQIGTVCKLVLSHIDYLVDSVSQRIRHIRHFPMAPKVLTAAIRVTGVEIVGPLLTDCVDLLIDVLDELGTSGRGGDLLLQELDSANHIKFNNDSKITHRHAIGLLDLDDPGLVGEVISVLYALIEVMANAPESKRAAQDVLAKRSDNLLGNVNTFKALNDKSKLIQDTDMHKVDDILGIQHCSAEIRAYFIERRKPVDDDADKNDSLSAKEFFEQRLKEAKPNRASIGNEMADELSEPTQKPDADPIPPTPFESLSHQILSNSVHFLSSDSPLIRVRVLRMLRMGISLLSNRPSDLNPLIHIIWPKLVSRVKDTLHYVALEAVLVIGAVVNVSPEFVRKRVSDDIIPIYAQLFKSLQTKASSAIMGKSKANESVANARPSVKRDVVSLLHPTSITSARNHIFESIDTTTVETRLFMACLSTLESMFDSMMLLRHDIDVLVTALIGLLNFRVYSVDVRNAVVDLIGRFIRGENKMPGNNGGNDWVWAVVWITAGASQLELTGGCQDKDVLLKSLSVTNGTREAFAPPGTYSEFDSERLIQVLDMCGEPGVSVVLNDKWAECDLAFGGRWTQST
ncbi:TEL2-interacting protein 1 [Batrachochytrium dendrobatidis]|nr:TEL2-interacting protein 1 [Batrachochytrium dendrobatidis]